VHKIKTPFVRLFLRPLIEEIILSAYQIARTFKRNYKKFILYVFGKCKSAGTLIAVGANEIVMSEHGQFGPLDIQLADKEELFGQTPALDVQQSLATLSKFTFDTFFDFLLKINPAGLSTKIASDLAKNLALGITTPIAAQIDPLLLGRVDRSMKIAEAYSERLQKDFKGKAKLSGGYPSHSFIIDYEEADTIFSNLRAPDEDEKQIEKQARAWNRCPNPGTDDWAGLLSKEKQITNDSDNERKPNSNGEHAADSEGKSQPTKTSASLGITATAR